MHVLLRHVLRRALHVHVLHRGSALVLLRCLRCVHEGILCHVWEAHVHLRRIKALWQAIPVTQPGNIRGYRCFQMSELLSWNSDWVWRHVEASVVSLNVLSFNDCSLCAIQCRATVQSISFRVMTPVSMSRCAAEFRSKCSSRHVPSSRSGSSSCKGSTDVLCTRSHTALLSSKKGTSSYLSPWAAASRSVSSNSSQALLHHSRTQQHLGASARGFVRWCGWYKALPLPLHVITERC